MCVRAPRGTPCVEPDPSICPAPTNLEDIFLVVLVTADAQGRSRAKTGRRFTRMKRGSPVTGSLGTQGALNGSPLCLTHRDTGCSARSPHPWERTHRAGFPPILTSASALYQPHTMGLGTTPASHHPQSLPCWEMGSSFHPWAWGGVIFRRDQS